MTCSVDGSDCETPRRRLAKLMLVVMLVIFTALSVFSFLSSRGQVTPNTVSFGPYKATDGKRIFQAYNCMGCHTMVGNSAYLGPDLTEEYKIAGPAWLAAFLPSAGGWPTAGAIRAQLLDSNQQAETGTNSVEAYLQKFPGAAERIERRGGGTTMMPNLPFSKDEIGQLIAYLKYTSAMDTEGWPPKIEAKGGLEHRLRLSHSPAAAAPMPVALAAVAPTPVDATAVPAAKPALDPAALGAQLVEENGCLACHAVDDKRLVGPGWGGLYNSKVKLANGQTVTADVAYLRESILKPNAKIVAGYQPDMMPEYDQLFSEGEINAIVAYLQILGKK